MQTRACPPVGTSAWPPSPLVQANSGSNFHTEEAAYPARPQPEANAWRTAPEAGLHLSPIPRC
eukprot:15459766-Alexandrium_andersonii.AAC.1